jgi:bifunctional non-homologous end joining protein LigD
MAKAKHVKMPGKKAPFPGQVEPMLARLVEKVQNDDAYVYEVKWDGYRIISFVRKGKAVLHSRSGLDYTGKYLPVADELKNLKHDAVLDGEVVVLNEKGIPDFDALQRYNGNDPICYYVFDILWLDGYSLKALPLLQRKDILHEILKQNDILRISESFDDGVKLFEQIKQVGIEGIVAKRKESRYIENDRSDNWLKMKTDIRQEYVIGGWAESERGRLFGSLLFGYYKGKDFYYLGHTGGGFKDKEMPVLFRKLQKLEIKKKPFVNEAEADTKIHWVKPELVANIKFDTFTRSGKIRKPAIFLGLRDDKKPTEVQYEPPVVAHTIKREKFHLASPTKSNWQKVEKPTEENSSTVQIGKHDLLLFNVEREVWRGVPKAKLIQYYHSVAQYMLPHLKDRPLSLHVKDRNVYAQGFYLKDMEGNQPEWAEVFTVERKHKEEGKRDEIDYLVCQNEATLLYTINLGCVDVNPWLSRKQKPEEPDYIVIDIDPTVKEEADVDFSKVLEVAVATKEYLDSKKLKAFCKTSGKTGIHYYIPCRGFEFGQTRAFAEMICKEIHKMLPKITTMETETVHRGNNVYLDSGQNDYADTLAAPYCARPWIHKTVSTPLEWKEINKNLNPLDFTISTITDRLKKKGDLFKDVLSETIAKKNNGLLKKLLG